MNPTIRSQIMRASRLRYDEWPVVADGVTQSMVTLGPDVMETIMDQIRAVFSRAIGRRRRANVEPPRFHLRGDRSKIEIEERSK